MIERESYAHQKEVHAERAQGEDGDDVKDAKAVRQRQAVGKTAIQRAVYHKYGAAQSERQLRQNGYGLLYHLKPFIQIDHDPLLYIPCYIQTVLS